MDKNLDFYNIKIIYLNKSLDNQNFIRHLITLTFNSINIEQIIINSLNTINENKIIINSKNNKNKWIFCGRACLGIAELFKLEINSTLYMLNIISNSLITVDEGSYIEFKINSINSINNLTGKWSDDSKYFTFEIKRKDGSIYHSDTRLIMGYGPSSSGKTYCAKTIINMLSKSDINFPKSLITIDGGIYREKSYIYHKLIIEINKRPFNGLKNLVLSGIKFKSSFTNKSILQQRVSLFDSNIVKKNVMKYFEQLEKISLYVPETLGGCLFDCTNSAYRKYINLTGDKDRWIGLFIWQHKTHKDCNFPIGTQCKGCTESGLEREKKEGKKYSSAAWNNSYLNGLKYMKLAPGGNYEIHNSGGYPNSISTLIDFSKNKIITKNDLPNGFVFQNNSINYSVKIRRYSI